MNRITIAVSGLNTADNPGPGIGVARSIRKDTTLAADIIGLAYDAMEPGIYMDWVVDKAYLMPYPAAGGDAYLQRLLQVCRAHQVDIVIPNLDAELPFFITYRDVLAENGVRAMLPGPGQLRLRGKDQLPAIGRAVGLSVPRTRLIASPEAVTGALEAMGTPVMVKGIYYEALRADTMADAAEKVHRLAAIWGYPVLLQEIVTGEHLNVVGVGDGRGGSLGMLGIKKVSQTVLLQTGLMNKFSTGTVAGPRVQSQIDDVCVDALAARFGSPLFVYSEKTIRARCREMHRAFATRYPHTAMAWSYKTNYLGAVCAVMHQEGALAEVVSEMEYAKARKLGVPGSRIVFNGPLKSPAALARAVAEGAIVNIDNLDELETLEALAARSAHPLRAGLRINLDAGVLPLWSRFGFNLESGEAWAAVTRMMAGGKLIPTGLHCHIGTFILDPEAYGRQVEKMVTFAHQIQDRFGVELDYLDIGGGFPSRNRLRGAFMPPDVGVPPVDAYAENICRTLLAHLRPGQRPRLIIESGRALIDDAGTLITTVVADKRLADGTKAYVVDAGVNLLFTANWYRFAIAVDRRIPGLTENSILYGPLCMNIDVVDEGLMLPPMRRGARLLVSPVGAYNTTQWLQFIHCRPAVVMVSEDRRVDVIREAEDLSDIDRREKTPQRYTIGISRGDHHDRIRQKTAA